MSKGKIFDTMVAYYVLQPEQDMVHGLFSRDLFKLSNHSYR